VGSGSRVGFRPAADPYRCNPVQVTDWEKINREDRKRHDQVAWSVGWTWTSIAAVGGILGLVFSSEQALRSGAMMLLVGLPLLVIGYRARRKNRDGADR